MRIPVQTILPRAICGAVAAVGLAAAYVPAHAQTVEEVTVTGRVGPDGQARTLSQTVSYADLDLFYPAGQDELGRRIDITARYLCNQLGETDASSDPVVPSCQDVAVKNAKAQARILISDAYARGPGWVPGQAWSPPGGR